MLDVVAQTNPTASLLVKRFQAGVDKSSRTLNLNSHHGALWSIWSQVHGSCSWLAGELIRPLLWQAWGGAVFFYPRSQPSILAGLLCLQPFFSQPCCFCSSSADFWTCSCLELQPLNSFCIRSHFVSTFLSFWFRSPFPQPFVLQPFVSVAVWDCSPYTDIVFAAFSFLLPFWMFHIYSCFVSAVLGFFCSHLYCSRDFKPVAVWDCSPYILFVAILFRSPFLMFNSCFVSAVLGFFCSHLYCSRDFKPVAVWDCSPYTAILFATILFPQPFLNV